MEKLLRFLKGDKGASAVEYALLVAMIAAVIVGAVTLLGGNLKTTFDYVAGIVLNRNLPDLSHRMRKHISIWKEEQKAEMKEGKKCPLFRRPESLSFGRGIGYCDMDGNSTNCDADIKFCEKPMP